MGEPARGRAGDITADRLSSGSPIHPCSHRLHPDLSAQLVPSWDYLIPTLLTGPCPSPSPPFVLSVTLLHNHALSFGFLAKVP